MAQPDTSKPTGYIIRIQVVEVKGQSHFRVAKPIAAEETVILSIDEVVGRQEAAEAINVAQAAVALVRRSA